MALVDKRGPDGHAVPFGQKDELLRERIEWVKSLLSSTNLSVGEITERAGFARESHLGRLFRQATGGTMLAWSRENRDAVEF